MAKKRKTTKKRGGAPDVMMTEAEMRRRMKRMPKKMPKAPRM